MVSTRSQLRISSAQQGRTRSQGNLERENDRRNSNDKRVKEQSDSKDGSQPPPKKRARTSKAVTKSGHKSKTQAAKKQLAGLMKLPVELLTEIICMLEPVDLLSLTCTNWYLRRMLLHRSSISIWKSAERNVPGLPECPYEGMSEPAYATLVFTRQCMVCGKRATARFDEDLGVRLCTPCRNAELVAVNPKLGDRWSSLFGLVNYSTGYKPESIPREAQNVYGSVFALRSEAEKILAIRNEYLRKRERKELAKYDLCQRKKIKADRKHRVEVALFQDHVESVLLRKKQALQNARRDLITNRLKDLGLTDQHLTFRHPYIKLWSKLVDVPKPLTDKIWANLLPELLLLILQNSEEGIKHELKRLRIARRAHVDQFLTNLKYTEHPYATILNALGAPVPEPLDLDHVRRSWWSLEYAAIIQGTVKIPSPFPKTQFALGWEVLEDIDQKDMGLEEAVHELARRKDQIVTEVMDWRVSIEEQLTGKHEHEQEEVTLLVKGSTDLTTCLSRNTRFLLRADVLFLRAYRSFSSGSDSDSYIREKYQTIFVSYYPSCVSSVEDFLKETPETPEYVLDSQLDARLDLLSRHTEAEIFVKRMLQDLGMPDVSHIELQLMGDGFICGRCSDEKPMQWLELIKHYLRSFSFYERYQNSKSKYRLRHPVVFQNVHDLAYSSDPLVRIATDAEKAQTSTSEEWTIWKNCYPCIGTYRNTGTRCSREMRAHLKDWHRIESPVEDVHFGNAYTPGLGRQWHDLWDEYYDGHATTPGSSGVASSA